MLGAGELDGVGLRDEVSRDGPVEVDWITPMIPPLRYDSTIAWCAYQ
jgi:hypothetical protein